MAVRCRAIGFLVLMHISLMVAACGLNTTASPDLSATRDVSPTSTQTPAQVEITFEVDLPSGTPAGEVIYLDVLDEVTGLGLNPLRYMMDQVQPQHYSTTISVVPGSLVKYRFTRGDRPVFVEYNCLGQQVRYRLVYVTGPDIAHDVVCQWNDLQISGVRGRITGSVVEANTGRPLPNILVEVGGVSTLSASDGSYLLEGLPPGKHNLIAASLDGHYLPYQQGAIIAENATTPARLELIPAPLVHVKFLANLPQGDDIQQPLFMVGNISALGNTFADMAGGINTVGYRAPRLSQEADGRYALEMDLPAGLDLRYKYTRGDGFWNGELSADGGFVVRQLIIPHQAATIEDTIAAWTVPNTAPIQFDVTVPQNTPAGDFVSIQLSAFGFTEPIPMWPGENGHWSYTLHNPLHLMTSLQYRYCRNNLCGSAGEGSESDVLGGEKTVSVSSETETIRDDVTEWAWWQGFPEPVDVEIGEQGIRDNALVTGVEFQTGYQPSWECGREQFYSHLAAGATSWVFLTPTWHYSLNNPPVLEPQPGKSTLWPDVLAAAALANDQGLQVALFPRTSHTGNDETWWLEAKRDADWWTRWFERYSVFLLNYADLAEKANVSALVMGEPGIEPAFPGGMLRDGSPSGVPEDAADRWANLLAQIRQRYHGQIIWAASYPGGLKLPTFVEDVDQLYILWSAPLAKTNDPKTSEIAAEFARRLAKDIQPLAEAQGKPVFIGLAYPSVDGGVMGCLKYSDGCLPFSFFDQPAADDPTYQIDLREQANVYHAALQVISLPDNAWIGGLISRGYYPLAALQDRSSSIHGKPAEALLTGWMAQYNLNPVD